MGIAANVVDTSQRPLAPYPAMPVVHASTVGRPWRRRGPSETGVVVRA